MNWDDLSWAAAQRHANGPHDLSWAAQSAIALADALGQLHPVDRRSALRLLTQFCDRLVKVGSEHMSDPAVIASILGLCRPQANETPR